MAAATPAKPVSRAEHQAAFKARLDDVSAIEAREIAEAEKAKARASNVANRARAVIESELAVESTKRERGAVDLTFSILGPRVDHYCLHRNAALASAVAQTFRAAETNMLHVTSQRLGRELAIVLAKSFLTRVPSGLRALAAIGNWQECQPLLRAIENANQACRREHDLAGHLDALVQLESVIGVIATEPGYQRVSEEDAPRAWEIISACHNGAEEERLLKALADEHRAAAVSAAAERSELMYRAVQGDPQARAKLNEEPGLLLSVLRQAASVIHQRLG